MRDYRKLFRRLCVAMGIVVVGPATAGCSSSDGPAENAADIQAVVDSASADARTGPLADAKAAEDAPSPAEDSASGTESEPDEEPELENSDVHAALQDSLLGSNATLLCRTVSSAQMRPPKMGSAPTEV